MAITTVDGIIAGAQSPLFFSKSTTANLTTGRPTSLWGLAGAPGAGSYDTTLNGVTLSSTSSMVAGQIPFINPVSGNTYMARLTATTVGQGGILLLCDRLWHNGGYTITSTSAQNSTTPTWPARDKSGATSGDGVMLGLEVSAATGSATPTITITYTNQSGTGSRSATNTVATGASSAVGSFYPIGLQSGDTGVRSVQSLTLSASWVSGTINLVAYRVIAALELSTTGVAATLDALTGGMPRLYDGSVPFFVFFPATSNAVVTHGAIVYTQG